jgi:hypothetical protein
MIHRVIFVCAVLGCSVPAQAADFRVAPVPKWVQRLPVDSLANTSASEHGVRYLVLDHQLRFGTQSVERYVRYAKKITDESGLQSATQVQIEFDPTYQTVLLHAISVVRGGERLNRLHPAAIKVVDRERNLEAQTYDGRKSLVLFLEDVRVGDNVDVEFTIAGVDPTLVGHLSETLILGALSPVGRLHVSVTVPAGRPMKMRTYGPDASSASMQPKITRTRNGDEYVWDRADVPAFSIDPKVPSWLATLPTVQLSDFGSWTEVARWASGLIHVPTSPSRSIVAQAKELRGQSSSTSAFVLAATRFVQDQVRYVALESGMSRRQPTDPEVVLARRFGDCKDKTVLLASLLRVGGVSADPALVSTFLREHLDDQPPGAQAFDHVILRVGPVDGSELWIDPTAMLQGGDILRARNSYFGRALVLRPDTSAPSEVPAEVLRDPLTFISDRYVIPKEGSKEPARLDVVREFRGAMANSMRANLRGSSREQTAKTYLQLYAQQFPGIETRAPTEVSDDREHDRLVITAHFDIRDAWKWGDKQHRWEFQVEPTLIGTFLEKPDVHGRTAPLTTPDPVSVRCSVELVLPHEWTVIPQTENISGPAFDFTFSSTATPRNIRYDYSFVSTADHVELAQLTDHVAALEKAKLLLPRVLTMRTVEGGANIWAWLVLLVATVGCAAAAPRVYRYTPPSAETAPSTPESINFWLGVVGLRVLTSPFVNTYSVLKIRWFFARSGWQSLMDPGFATYRPALALMIMGELAALIVFVAYGCIVALSFLKKRRSFPSHFTIYTISMLVYLVLDHGAVSYFGFSDKGQTFTNTIPTQIVFGLLFVLYVNTSLKAKQVFTRPSTSALQVSADAERRAADGSSA